MSMAPKTISQIVREDLGDSPFADAITCYISPAEDASFPGLPDTAMDTPAVWRDTCGWTVGKGVVLPGYDAVAPNVPLNSPAVHPTGNTSQLQPAPGTTWSFVTLLAPTMTMFGLWRAEWTELSNVADPTVTDPTLTRQRIAYGLFPTRNGLIKNSILNRYTSWAPAALSTNPPIISAGFAVLNAGDDGVNNFAGKYRVCSGSLTGQLDATDRTNSGTVHSASIGNSWEHLDSAPILQLNASGSATLSRAGSRYDWLGPVYGYLSPAELISFITQNDTYKMNPAKDMDGGAFDIVRSQSLEVASGNASKVLNPLAIDAPFSGTYLGWGNNIMTNAMPSDIEPQLTVWTNINDTAQIVYKARANVEAQPDAASPLNALRHENPCLPGFADLLASQRRKIGGQHFPHGANFWGTLAAASRILTSKIIPFIRNNPAARDLMGQGVKYVSGKLTSKLQGAQQQRPAGTTRPAPAIAQVTVEEGPKPGRVRIIQPIRTLSTRVKTNAANRQSRRTSRRR